MLLENFFVYGWLIICKWAIIHFSKQSIPGKQCWLAAWNSLIIHKLSCLYFLAKSQGRSQDLWRGLEEKQMVGVVFASAKINWNHGCHESHLLHSELVKRVIWRKYLKYFSNLFFYFIAWLLVLGSPSFWSMGCDMWLQ